MKPKTMMLMVVAIGCGLAASYMTSKLLAERNSGPPQENKVPVLVVKQKMTPWTPIKDPTRYFEVKEVPESLAPKKAVTALEKVQNQILGKALSEGAFLTEDDLLSKDQGELAAQMKSGERAIALRVNPESLAGGFVLPGSRVDVIATSRGSGSDSESRTIMQNMLVLAVDTKVNREEGAHSMLGSTVTLAARPEETLRLALAASTSELRLTLRPIGDTAQVPMQVTRMGDFSRPLVDGNRADDDGPVTALEGTKLPKLPPVKAAPSAAEEKVAKEEEPKKPAKPVKSHTLKIVNGENQQKARFVWDEDEKEWVLGGPSHADEAPVAPAEKDAEKNPEPAGASR